MLCIIEELTQKTWAKNIFPRLREWCLEMASGKAEIYYIDASPKALRLANRSCARWGIVLKRLDFRLVDVFADDGDLARLKIAYFDLKEVMARIKSSPEFRSVLGQADETEKGLGFFLSKQSILFAYNDADTIWRLLFLVYLARRESRKLGAAAGRTVLFAKKRLWLKEMKDYIRSWGVEIEPLPSFSGWKKSLIRFFGQDRLKAMLYLYKCYGLRALLMPRQCLKESDRTLDAFMTSCAGKSGHLMVEYNGHLNIERPELYSDLFFVQKHEACSKDVLVSFNYPADPLDGLKLESLRKFGVSAVALNPKSTKLGPQGIFHYIPSESSFSLSKGQAAGRQAETRWLASQFRSYRDQAAFWRSFFERCRVRAYLSWYKYDARHAIIADVLRPMNGVTALYQRAFESEPSSETAVDVDVFFGFCKDAARVEQASGSKVPYYVITGYNGDHRFLLVEKKAREVRAQLMKNGARRVIAYFDESSGPDQRWHTGHEFMRVSYEFLLGKVLEDKTLGLVFKPKVPGSLRQRLGPVAELLKQAEATGRCFVFQSGVTHGAYPPVAAAKAADIAVHGHLCAATAGIEAALGKVPTVLLDREGWPTCSLYTEGALGKTVFRSWESLWPVIQDHWKRPNGVPGFADWSGLLDMYDPFRDGRGAERVGMFLAWMMEGLKAGGKREQVLADTAQRYADMWGKDKVLSING